MKNVKLVKAIGKGWFLTIGDYGVENRWAVTSLELLATKKMIESEMKEIMEELGE